MLEKLERFQEAYDLSDEEFEVAHTALQAELKLKKTELNALLDWYEDTCDRNEKITNMNIQKTIDSITRKGW